MVTELSLPRTRPPEGPAEQAAEQPRLRDGELRHRAGHDLGQPVLRRRPEVEPGGAPAAVTAGHQQDLADDQGEQQGLQPNRDEHRVARVEKIEPHQHRLCDDERRQQPLQRPL